VPPVRSIEPPRLAVSIATRGLAASASARVFGVACAGAAGGASAGAPTTVGAAPGAALVGA
jgi:hypothetical protein